MAKAEFGSLSRRQLLTRSTAFGLGIQDSGDDLSTKIDNGIKTQNVSKTPYEPATQQELFDELIGQIPMLSMAGDRFFDGQADISMDFHDGSGIRSRGGYSFADFQSLTKVREITINFCPDIQCPTEYVSLRHITERSDVITVAYMTKPPATTDPRMAGLVVDQKSEEEIIEIIDKFEIDTVFTKGDIARFLRLASVDQSFGWNTHMRSFLRVELYEALLSGLLDEWLSVQNNPGTQPDYQGVLVRIGQLAIPGLSELIAGLASANTGTYEELEPIFVEQIANENLRGIELGKGVGMDKEPISKP